jgi:hypothetical protein
VKRKKEANKTKPSTSKEETEEEVDTAGGSMEHDKKPEKRRVETEPKEFRAVSIGAR